MNLEFTIPPRATPGFEQALVLFRERRYPEAEAMCVELLRREPGQAHVLHLLGLILADRGDTANALGCLEQALKLNAQDPKLLGAHALMLFRAWRLDEAERAARAALALDPQLTDVVDILGSILWRRGDVAAARECFARALQQTPEHAGAWGNLALLNEQSNRVAEAERMAEQGLALRPQDVMLRLVRGRCLRRRGEFLQAQAQLEPLAQGGTVALRRDAGYEIALCADALGTADLAWAHAERANRLAEQAAPHAFKDGQDFLLQIQGLHTHFTPEWVAAWRALPGALKAPAPAFLVGFPRSGTTLLDSMLEGHPDIAVLEERATEQAMVTTLNQLPGGYPEALRDLTPEQHTQVRQSYFNAAALAEGERRRIVDKSPFLTVHLGMVQRIFPGAQIIFMLRHPCDVVLSCFMTSLELNSGTVHFTRMQSSVDLYCKVMSLWQRYREVLPLNCHQIRYEDLLDNPEANLRPLLEFLDVSWSAEVLRHAEHVPERGNIKSASYAQVSRPVYQSSRDRWQRYRKYLEPHLEQLRPWCERFGYAL